MTAADGAPPDPPTTGLEGAGEAAARAKEAVESASAPPAPGTAPRRRTWPAVAAAVVTSVLAAVTVRRWRSPR